MDRHVIPVDDLVAHEATRQCLCRPTITPVGPFEDAVVAHHSYDGREYDEPDHVPETPNA